MTQKNCHKQTQLVTSETIYNCAETISYWVVVCVLDVAGCFVSLCIRDMICV